MVAKDKKFVEEITAMEDDFAQWYTDVVKKADLVDYSSVRGSMIIRPYGFAIWENIRDILDGKIKETGHENIYMPLLIPESLLQKEKDHIEGFAPEVAWVTHGGSEELAERLVIRPTSEVLFGEHYANIIHSYRDLPKLYNQWANVVRWEKTTRPFLRSLEFLWQEGHTCHATSEDAQEETARMLDMYAEVCEKYLAIPVLRGRKTDKEKFAGAVHTLTIESLMHDGKALQSGTSHYLGTGFAEAFGIQFTDKNGELQTVHQTSWGITTRIIGALIMVHGDNRGLVVPPKVAPKQVMIVPIAQHKEGVLDKAYELRDQLKKVARVDIDASDKMPGWKFNESEMKGIPVRLEVGPKDIEKGQVVLVRRDTGEKIFVPMAELETKVVELLEDIQNNLFEKAKAHREEKTSIARNMDEFKQVLVENPGFIKAMWCGDVACENFIKDETSATSRCIPFEGEPVSDTCVCCGGEAKHLVYWAKAY
ncbi:proline--tRNA ligase [Bacillus sporothermodurans]|uniref:Proline--tRNA ligase n=2 Tax=Bacillaceae TaxID=186817 RepID=A0AB37HIL9_9BACI|nr:proline--tRNA ligase [Heyndrickxia sporothermodurans]MBL5769124.1 proline--tRNA ligase [Heyndrickxia sporothermodurans]MBL5772906.1 proline--tRNA ligase [Heyndrickxia sporothermodurans]MBL5776360.1 proline--tRNA ligase [Heyndrickxia sporothermodurans]MBL5779903.1 proline--tRNA ligase [Heyndrickxia sporothermodurans]MBL5783496.1 proline--tRNA ligase [Heyndrickxia sporothermodurans]